MFSSLLTLSWSKKDIPTSWFESEPSRAKKKITQGESRPKPTSLCHSANLLLPLLAQRPTYSRTLFFDLPQHGGAAFFDHYIDKAAAVSLEADSGPGLY